MMVYLAYISFAFLGLQLVNVMLNFVFRQKLHNSATNHKKLVSVLIPARNEEKNIGNLLSDLSKIHDQTIEIIVFNDQSTDQTEKIVQSHIRKDNRIRLIQSEKLPKGWLGKNHACYQLAKHANGDALLFIDADVRLKGAIISDAVTKLEKYNLGLLSIFPTQITTTFGEKISVPIMNYILLTLLPLVFVRISPFASHSAANGQFMLFDATVYRKQQPHSKFRNSAIEDIAIAQFYKKKKLGTCCLTGATHVKCRMYNSYNESLSGFAKNVFMFFGNMPVLAFLFWILVSLGFIPILIALPQFLEMYLFAIIMVQFLYSLTSKQNPIQNTLLFPLQLLFMIQVLFKGLIVKKQKRYTWKERNIYAS